MGHTIRVKRQRLALVALMAAALISIGATTGAAPSADKMFFLVATRDLPDPLFQQSVILMIPDTPPPLVVGLIVNKPTDKQLKELLPDSSFLKNRSDVAYFGGPVDVNEPTLVFRSGIAPERVMSLFEDVYAALNPERVADLLKGRTLQDLRLYFGRAQWSREQLHSEMLRGSWYVVPADPSFVFSADPKQVWHALVERAELRKASARHWMQGTDPFTSFESGARF